MQFLTKFMDVIWVIHRLALSIYNVQVTYVSNHCPGPVAPVYLGHRYCILFLFHFAGPWLLYGQSFTRVPHSHYPLGQTNSILPACLFRL